MPVLTLLPTLRRLPFEPGPTLLEILRAAGILLSASCGGRGLCGKCRVRVAEGTAPPSPGCEHALSQAELAAGWRLACLVRPSSDLSIELPETETATTILVDFGSVEVTPDAGVTAVPVDLPPPELSDQRSDVERLAGALGRPLGDATGLDVVRSLPGLLRRREWKATAILRDDELLGLEPRDFAGPLLGLAVDVGTTTVAGVLVDLATGESLATASCTNPQAVHGDDVLSRIAYASTSPGAVNELRRLIVGAINAIAREAAEKAGHSPARIYKAVAAGNTTMHHLLLGIDPAPIGQAPFVPVRRAGWSLRAARAGFELAPGARLYAMPNISAYVGGDITAGILAHGIHRAGGVVLFIDIGTNGEMALRAGNVTYACSTAAGPAFEGARIRCGMRASTGAISRVAVENGDLAIGTVGEGRARGLCGTGLLDAAAALLDLGAIDEAGRLLAPEELGDGAADSFRARLVRGGEDGDGEPEVLLASPERTGAPRVALTSQDVRELQLAKGAIAAGYQTMLGLAGLGTGELDRVVLAGAFGSFLRPQSARRIGLLPPEMPLDRVESVGNAALAGARLALLNRARRVEAEELARSVRHIELSGRADFQAFFLDAMMFPG